MVNFRRWYFLALLFLLPTHGRADVVYEIKASYLYNFLQFVQFGSGLSEAGSKDSAANRLNVCIIGKNKFGKALDEIQGASTSQGIITVIRYSKLTQTTPIKECHAIYMVGISRVLSKQMLSRIDTSKTLTIGEFSGFIELGGFIELFIENDSVRFRINSNLAGNTQFKVAAQLLSLGVQDS
ncbi:YfiR family protein [Litoribrevibacter euphylliae]|uniref:YfiR family protein n=1 Tax=Litoribrevibacter euphylliae TaxID=1834034 RepID=A0ABV7HGY8_9GAMM